MSLGKLAALSSLRGFLSLHQNRFFGRRSRRTIQIQGFVPIRSGAVDACEEVDEHTKPRGDILFVGVDSINGHAGRLAILRENVNKLIREKLVAYLPCRTQRYPAAREQRLVNNLAAVGFDLARKLQRGYALRALKPPGRVVLDDDFMLGEVRERFWRPVLLQIFRASRKKDGGRAQVSSRPSLNRLIPKGGLRHRFLRGRCRGYYPWL